MIKKHKNTLSNRAEKLINKRKHEIILSVGLSIGMIVLILWVGVVTWNRVNYCYDNPTSESPMNCSLRKNLCWLRSFKFNSFILPLGYWS